MIPLSGMVFVLVFLVYGGLREAAPTHHPIRALVPVWIVLAAIGGLGVVDKITYVGLGVVWAAVIGWRIRDLPGAGETEHREAQIAVGHQLAAEGATDVDVIPCAYEHFALIAAFGAPERVRVLDAVPAAFNEQCPRVLVR
jgi:hypothetical protein